MSHYLLVLSNFPDRTAAEQAARRLIEKRLAACVNILAECSSMYQWKNNIEVSQEVPLLIKTTPKNYAQLETILQECHPYQLPEIIALPISHGLPAYLNWIDESCDASATTDGSLLTAKENL